MLGLPWVLQILKTLNITLHVQENLAACQVFIKKKKTSIIYEKTKSQKTFARYRSIC